MNITVCIGSSCHIKGSRQVVDRLQKLISDNNMSDKIELGGRFCMGKCQQGVCVTLDDSFFSVTPESVDNFFNENVLKSLKWEVFPYFAQKFGVSETRIYSIATFYEVFSIEIKCKYVIKICEYTGCVAGGQPFADHTKQSEHSKGLYDADLLLSIRRSE